MPLGHARTLQDLYRVVLCWQQVICKDGKVNRELADILRFICIPVARSGSFGMWCIDTHRLGILCFLPHAGFTVACRSIGCHRKNWVNLHTVNPSVRLAFRIRRSTLFCVASRWNVDPQPRGCPARTRITNQFQSRGSSFVVEYGIKSLFLFGCKLNGDHLDRLALEPQQQLVEFLIPEEQH